MIIVPTPRALLKLTRKQNIKNENHNVPRLFHSLDRVLKLSSLTMHSLQSPSVGSLAAALGSLFSSCLAGSPLGS